jgi:hypothetical protein
MPRTIIKWNLKNLKYDSSHRRRCFRHRKKREMSKDQNYWNSSTIYWWTLSIYGDKLRLIYRNFQSARAFYLLFLYYMMRKIDLKWNQIFNRSRVWILRSDRYIKGIFTVILIWTFIKIGYVIIQMWVTAPHCKAATVH